MSLPGAAGSLVSFQLPQAGREPAGSMWDTALGEHRPLGSMCGVTQCGALTSDSDKGKNHRDSLPTHQGNGLCEPLRIQKLPSLKTPRVAQAADAVSLATRRPSRHSCAGVGPLQDPQEFQHPRKPMATRRGAEGEDGARADLVTPSARAPQIPAPQKFHPAQYPGRGSTPALPTCVS